MDSENISFENKIDPWNVNLRYKVGQKSTHLGKEWINKTGKNSEPSIGLDWAFSFQIENKKPIISKFTLVQKSTNNANDNIELGDYAKGFGPGIGVDVEYWNLAIYQNLTADNNVHNYLNYKPIGVLLPNS